MSGLVGDIGGTNARFALAVEEGGRIALFEPRSYANKSYPSPEAAIRAYLSDIGADRPEKAVLAVAGPINQGAIRFTNLDWELSEARLCSHGGLKCARLINDFAAQALGAIRVTPDKLLRLGPEIPTPSETTLAVLGPGTGFGVAGLIREPSGRELVLSTEGGHAGFAPTDETEIEIWRRFCKHERVSIERILSGSGFYELYLALADIEGVQPTLPHQEEVQKAALNGDALAMATVDRFCRILGSTAGDIALGLGARGGVYVSGGVAGRMADQMAAGGFRQRFDDKGRFEGYMRAIPVWLVRDPFVALLGAASVLKSLEPPKAA
jgi:glucokinase